MDGISILLNGRYGHFKRAETNNSPLTYPFMTKVALIGLIGAMEGIDRENMEKVYPQLCEDLIYSISLLHPIEKENVGFSKLNAVAEHFGKRGRRTCEVLRNPSYEVIVGIKNERSRQVFDTCKMMLANKKRIYPLCMGNLNCPLDIEYLGDINISDEKTGEFETSSVVSSDHKILMENDDSLDISFDIVPISEKDWKYTKNASVICTTKKIKVSGVYRTAGDKDFWFM